MSERLMDGFPPRAETQVTLANWRSSPFSRWAFQHVREIVPTADIANDPRGVRELSVEPVAFDGLRITAANGKALTLDQSLAATSTDCLVVLHKGSIVLERYFNDMTPRSPHILMSVSKSMLGLIAGVLVGQGVLDASRFVTGEAIRADGGLLAAGPRMDGLSDPHGAFRRYTGYADGTTGRPAEKRRLVPKEPAPPQ